MKWFELFDEVEMYSLYSAVGIEPPINGDDNSGYEGGDVGQKVKGSTLQVIGITKFSHRGIGNNFVSTGCITACFFIQNQKTVLTGNEESRSN